MTRHPLDLPSNVDTKQTAFERMFGVSDTVVAYGYILGAGIAVAAAVGGLVYVGFMWEKAWIEQGRYLLALAAAVLAATISVATWLRVPVVVYLVVGLATPIGYAVAHGYVNLFLP